MAEANSTETTSMFCNNSSCSGMLLNGTEDRHHVTSFVAAPAFASSRRDSSRQYVQTTGMHVDNSKGKTEALISISTDSRNRY